MVFNWFSRNKKNIPKVEENNGIYSTLIESLDEMDKKGVDRVFLTLYETEPTKNSFGRWIRIDKPDYYSFDMLEEIEKEMIREGKHYTIISLVRENVCNEVNYPLCGLEICRRTHVIPLLPKLKPESTFNYATDGQIVFGENLKRFAEESAKSGWTKEAIKQRVNEGINDYKDITHKLMDSAGIYSVLEEMEKREYSPLEEIMEDIKTKVFTKRK